MATPYCVAFVTVPDKAVAEKLAEALVETRTAACVNIVPGLRSVYRWEGKVEKGDELLLVIKTRQNLMPETFELVKKNHPYKVPEFIWLPIEDGSPTYLDWLGANARYARPDPRRARG